MSLHISISSGNELQQQPKLLLDVTSRGYLMSKGSEDAISIIEKISLSDHKGHHNRNPSQGKNGTIELNTNDVILGQNKLLTQKMDDMTKHLSKLPQ